MSLQNADVIRSGNLGSLHGKNNNKGGKNNNTIKILAL